MPTVTVSLWQSAVDGLLEFIDEVGQSAEIQTRTILPPTANSVDQRINFTTFAVIEKMAFTNLSGVSLFDSVGVERILNNEAYFAYISDVTSEMFVLFQGKRYDIVTITDIGEIHGILKLQLEMTGSDTKEASKLSKRGYR